LEEKDSRPKFAISDQRHLLSAQILGGCPFGVALLGEDAETNPCDLKASFSGLQIVGVSEVTQNANVMQIRYGPAVLVS